MERPEQAPQQRRQTTELDALVRHCARRLDMRLVRPPRRDGDWSIELGGDCGCELCDVLGEFLAEGARRTLEWPLAKEGRRHVHGRLDGAELPVTHQTRRTSRPYTLVLTKTDALFERDSQARRRDQADLAWLHRQANPTAPASRPG